MFVMAEFLNLHYLNDASLVTDPYEYLIVPQFVKPSALTAIGPEYPKIEQGGSFPLHSLTYGPTFERFCNELQSEEMRAAFEQKFGIDLTDRPTTLTVRGRCRMKDGKVHTDSRSKLVTVLVYLNETWDAGGGRLRLLRSDNIDDVIEEAPPELGTMIAFINRENAWHGHLPFDGERRVMQLNWVVSDAAVKRSERRHGWSAWIKNLIPKRAA
jgi:SM-20-related protein